MCVLLQELEEAIAKVEGNNGCRVIIENSPVGESEANGSVEIAIQ